MKQCNVLLMISPMSQPRLRGISRFAKEHGWYLMIQDRLGYRPLAWRGDGVITTLRASDPVSVACIQSLRRKGIPVVDLTIEHPEIKLPRVMNDHIAIGRLAAEYFADRHFRNIAWFSTGWSYVHQLRFQGLAETWGPRRPPAKWVASDSIPAKRFTDWNYFSRWLGKLLRNAPKPLAVLVYDETDAARLLNICLALNLSVPEEVAILAIGNDQMLCESQAVSFSSVSQDLERGGYEGARLLQRLMDGKRTPAKPILIPLPGVVARQSTDTIGVEDPVLREALLFIRDHLSTAFGVEQISAAIGVQRSKLERMFQAEFRHSVGKEILRQRLSQAKLLLRNSRMSIAQIADQMGFCNAGYFINAFKKSEGPSPRAWRKKQEGLSASAMVSSPRKPK